MRAEPRLNAVKQGQEYLGHVDLQPAFSYEELRQIKPKYKINSDLFMQGSGLLSKQRATDWGEGLGSTSRNPELEKLEVKDLIDHKPIDVRAIADTNFQEMERATALKWKTSLARLFNGNEVAHIPTHRKDGRLSIAVPGCHLGFEIGGILDFFNGQHAPVDVEAVDLREAGAERQFQRLEDRTSVLGSGVQFHSQTDATEFFAGKKNDIVILRHPGFVFEPDQYYIWEKMVKTLCDTNPALVIVSTYNHVLKDEAFIDMVVGRSDKKEIYEDEIFEKWLKENGYVPEDKEWVTDDRLEYPRSPYMISAENKNGKLEFTLPVDRFIRLYRNPEANTK